MSVTLRYDAKFHVDETPALALDLASNPVVSHRCSYSGVSGTLDSASTVAIDDVFSDRRSLTAGALTLDLSALTSTLATTKDFTGKRVKGLFVMGSPSNTGGILIKKGASNGYEIFGSSSGQATVHPGCPLEVLFGSNLAVVGAANEEVDFSSADLDAEFEIILVVGT
jgi:hypothetical protein